MLTAEIKNEQQVDGEFMVEATEYGHLVFTETGRLNIDALTRIGSLTAEHDAVILPGVARACNAFMAVCPRDKAMEWLADVERQAKDQSGGDRELEWLLGPHVGDSSETIFSVLSDKHCHRLSDPARVVKFRPATPSDPDDFSRCYRLLQMVPEWAGRIAEVGETYADWKPFAGNWGELTEIYEAEVAASEADGRTVPVCPKLWERLKELSEMSTLLWGARSQMATTPGASDTKNDSEGDASANHKPDLRALYPVPDAACSRGQFLADVVKHEMTVLLDHPDGYRHIRFKFEFE